MVYRVYPDPKHPEVWGVFRHDGNDITVMCWRKEYDDAIDEAARLAENDLDK